MGARTSRSLACALAFGTALAFAPVVLAGDPQPEPQAAPKPQPKMAADADAIAAVAEFKEAFKAKGLKGEDRTSQRDFAMARLATLQHPLVVEALASVSRESDPMLRMLSIIYLGDQTLLPGLAGKHVVAAWKRNVGDDACVLSAMQSVARLKYLGARDDLRAALKSQSFPVKKEAITTIVRLDDLRLLGDLLALVGVQVPSSQGSGATSGGGPAAEPKPDAKNSGGAETTTEGYSWEGAEEFKEGVEPGSQEAAEMEKRVNEQVEKNRKEAEAAAKAKEAAKGGGGVSPSGGTGGGAAGAVGGGGDGGSAAPGGKGGGRSNSGLSPIVLGALIKLTGQRFTGPAVFKTWWTENSVAIGEKMKKLDEKEKLQKAEAAAQAK